MAAELPPYVNAHGLIGKLFEGIKKAQTPPRFTQDFLGTKLGLTSGSAKALLPLLKRIGFLGTDGVPTEIYKQFRNPIEAGSAMAEAMRKGYANLFERNEYAYNLDRQSLEGLVMAATGLEHDSPYLRPICSTFEALKTYASFEGGEILPAIKDAHSSNSVNGGDQKIDQPGVTSGLNLSYTINLNLPETANPAVFNAIFKSLKEHLLRK